MTFGSARRGPHLRSLARQRGDGRDCDREVDLMMAIFGAILPRFLLIVGWANDQTYWQNLLGAPIWFLAGFLFLPWTTFIYGLVQQNGLSVLDWIFLGCGLLIDLGTWGVGAFATRKQVSNFRGM